MKRTLQELTIKDDFLFGAVMLEEANCRRLLELAAGISVGSVEVSREKSFVYHPEYRGVRLDVYAKDEKNTRYNVEMQVVKRAGLVKRARYYRSQMDMDLLLAGYEYEELPETYVIFITRDDTLGYGLPVYHVTRKIEEVGADFGDEAYILYVNAGTQEDTELGRLMHDFHCRRAEDMYSEILAERVRELKETQEGVDIMCREMDEIYREGQRYGEKRGEKRGEERGIKLGEKRGEERGIAKGKQEMAFSLLRMGMPVEEIAKAASVSVELVEKWLEKDLKPVG